MKPARQQRKQSQKTLTAEAIEALCRSAGEEMMYSSKRALARAYKALQAAENLGDARLLADCCYTCGDVHLVRYEEASALVLLKRAYTLYTEVGVEYGRYRAQCALARTYVQHGNMEEALHLVQECLDYFSAIGDMSQKVRALLRLSEVQCMVGAFDHALEHVLAALQCAEQFDVPEFISGCYLFLALIHHYQGNRDVEKSYCLQALHTARLYRYPKDEVLALAHLVNWYLQHEMLEEAAEYLREIRRKRGVEYPRYPVLHAWSLWHGKKGHRKKAAFYRRKAIAEISRQGLQTRTLAMCIETGVSLIGQQEYDEAIYYLEMGLNIAQEAKNRFFMNSCYQLLAECYQALGVIDKAFACYKQHTAIDREFFDEEKQKMMAEMQAKFNVEQTEREKALLQTKHTELTAAFDEVRRLNETLTRLNTEKNEVLGVVAHDLKGPLSGVRMVASLLRDYHRRMPVEDVEQQLEQIVETTDRMLAISSNLLSVQRLESGEVYGEAAPVELCAFARTTVEGYRPIAAQKGVLLISEWSESCTVVCSEEALRSMLENLISNALKFTASGGHVWVRVRPQQSRVVIEVEDEGPGISPADRKKLYGRYTRLSARPTAGESSTGLGLWITRKAVQAIGGTIRCVSELGRGTTFLVRIPL